MPYPENDKEFEDQKIDSVSQQQDGTYMISCDGWSLWCGKECPVKPEAGQTARMYGRGIGFAIRGLFIDGVKVWYRTDADEKNHREIESYGADAKDWLARWDRGDTVWSIEMGGLGPGYEQCIHITCAEILRWLIENASDTSKWDDKGYWQDQKKRLEDASFESLVIKPLGLSGAQWGAAMSLACQLYRNGPRKVMTDEQVKDRHIQVSKFFPGSKAA